MYKVALELTKNCNLNCKYCYQSHLSNEMDIETAYKAVDLGVEKARALKNNKLLLSFFGGEPLLQFHNVKSIVEYAKLSAIGFEVFFEMTTNGTLLTSKILDFFSENQFFLKVSLDGLPYYHDLNRITRTGTDSYPLIIRNLELLKEYQKRLKKPVQVSMVISKNNYSGLLSNMEHLIDLGFRMFDTALNFEDDWTQEDMPMLRNEFDKVVHFYYERLKKGQGFMWTFIDNGMMPQIKPRKNYFCGAGIQSFFVSTEGSLFPCFACFKDEVRIGSVQEGIDGFKSDRFKHYVRDLKNDCIECTIKSYCPACDCLMMNMEKTNDFNTVPMVFCEHAKMRYELTNKLYHDPEWNETVRKMNASRGE